MKLRFSICLLVAAALSVLARAQTLVQGPITYGPGQNVTVLGPSTIQTSGAVAVTTGANANFYATSSITLNAGFTCSGATFQASINPNGVQVTAPTFSPGAGAYTSAQTVTITSTTSGASISYTTDGSTPTETHGILWPNGGSVSISSTTTLTAIAFQSGCIDSSVTVSVFTINLPVVSAPSFSPAAGTFTGAQSVTIASTTSGASIRYTTDGVTTPSETAGMLYSGPVSISVTTTLKAIAYKTGYTDSAVTTAAYSIGTAPVFTITASAGANGSISPTGAVPVSQGANQSFTITPNSGYVVSSVTVDGASQGAITSYMFSNVQANHTISAAFQPQSSGEGSYGGSAAAIPGRVQAENYDTGGQGVAYNVTSINGTANSYRSDGVDLETTLDTGGGYDLGWSTGGQWFKYTVDVATAGLYSVSFRVADLSAVTDAFHLANSSGTNLSGSIDLPASGGFQTWTTVTAFVTLPAGQQVLTLDQDNGGWNINYLSFAVSAGLVSAPSFSPAAGTYSSAPTVTITSATAGASIAYTTDGSTPTESGGAVTNGILLSNGGAVSISSTATLSALAFKIGYTDSAVTSGTYTITFPVITSQPQVASFSLLYSFTGLNNGANADGASPHGGLIQGTDGRLYGTTSGGGTNGNGTVFAVNQDGTGFSTLHIFAGNDGAWPVANLIQGIDGRFYGTTNQGGANGSGTVFAVSPDGTVTTLHNFNGSDGANPDAALVQGSDGNLYGTASQGGANSNGTVFKQNPNGTGGTDGKGFTLLYNFTSDSSGTNDDGAHPNAGLIQEGSDGLLYGVASGGGVNGVGTVFAINPNGTGGFALLYGFTGANDGDYPSAGLIQGYDGRLYGTDPWGANGFGTVFAMTPTLNGAAVCTPIYSFTGANDGANPVASLVQGTDGRLYGTAQDGGVGGDGTVFAVEPDGAGISLLYGFTGGNDGSNPTAALIRGSDGRFYGTTSMGGSSNDGTLFAVSTQGSAIVGSTVTFTVSATSIYPLSYQWLKNGTPISGATNSTLVLTNVTTSNVGSYAVIVSNSAGSVTSSPVQLAVAVAAPAFSPSAGTYTSAQTVTITSTTSGVSIAYTTDGSTPTEVGGRVTRGNLLSNGGAVSIGTSATLNAVAFETGYTDSTITSGSYALQAIAPVFSLPAGPYTSSQMVTITSATSGASIAYTTDGSSPIVSSGVVTHGTLCSGPVNISSTSILCAMAFEAGLNNSAVASATYAFPPGVPTSLAVSNVTMTSVTLTWVPPANGLAIAGYEVLSNGTFAGVSATNSLTITGLSPATTYALTAFTLDVFGDISAGSAPLNINTLADVQPPNAPTGLAASGVSATFFTLNWAASSGGLGVAGYNILVNGAPAGTSSSTTFVVTGLTLGNTYSVTVAAVDPFGVVSPASAPLSVTTVADTQPPTQPTALAISDTLADAVTLTWSASTDNVGVTGYNIYQNGTLVGSSPTTSFTVTGLNPQTAYNFTVKATDAAGNVSAAAATSPSSVTTANVPAFLGISLWLKADTDVALDNNGLVNAWADQSGLGNNATQNPAYNEPSPINSAADPSVPNGYSVVRFTQAQNTGLGLPNLFSGASGGEAFAVLRRSSNTNVVGLWSFGGLVGSRYPNNINQIQDDFATNTWYNPGLVPIALTNFHIYDVGGDSTIWFQNLNGRQYFQQMGNTVSFRSNPVIGDGQGCAFDGDIAEIIVYDRVLSDPERLSVVQYLNTKYALGLTLNAIPPAAPTGLTATVITASSFHLQWTASTGNVPIAAYDLLLNGEVAGTTSTTSFTIGGLSAATNYNVTVRARDVSSNDSAPSIPLSVTTAAPLAPPTGLTTTNTGSGSVTVAWAVQAPGAGVASYRVYNNGVLAGTTTGTSFTLNGLVPDAPQNITVTAVDAAGNASVSSVALNVTTPDGTSTGGQPTATFVFLPESGYEFGIISGSGIALLTESAGDNTNYYRWQCGNMESIISSKTGTMGGPYINQTGTIALQTNVSSIDVWLPGASAPQTITASSTSGVGITNTEQNEGISGSPRYFGNEWEANNYQMCSLQGLSDDNRVWFTDIESDYNGDFFQTTVNNVTTTYRFIDLLAFGSYYANIPGGGRTLVGSGSQQYSWPPFTGAYSGASEPSWWGDVASYFPGLSLMGVSDNGIPFGSANGSYYVGSRNIGARPVAVNKNGTALESIGQVSEGEYLWNAYRLEFADGTTSNLPTGPWDFLSIDDQDRPHGYYYSNDAGFLLQPMVVNGTTQYQTIPYVWFVPPVGWGIGFTVPPDLQKPGLGLMQNIATRQYQNAIAFPMGIAVDANRDGNITFAREGNFDQTSQGQPFRFWVNDDDDTEFTLGPDGVTQVPNETDQVPVITADYTRHQIVSKRNLEDFTRLWIDMKGTVDALNAPWNTPGTTPTSYLQIGLKWENTNGTTPAINIYRSADSTGSSSYLTSDTAAAAQISSGDPGDPTNDFNDAITDVHGRQTVDTTGTFILPPSIWQNLTDANPVLHLLFEGAAEGTGQLTLVILDANGNELGEGPGVWIDLKDIKEMYDQYRATPATLPPPFDSQTGPFDAGQVSYERYPGRPDFQPAVDEASQVLVFVNGSNETYLNSTNRAETLFKRLWWQGYKGRFISFRWETLVGPFNGALPAQYNLNEWMAWTWGKGLRDFVSSSNIPGGYTVNVAAHSLGNLLVGSALQLGMSASNVVLMQGAIPAGCFDSSGGQSDPASTNGYAPMWTAEAEHSTPDLASALGYRGFVTNAGKATIYSFYNTSDYALATGPLNAWEGNQEDYKPDDLEWWGVQSIGSQLFYSYEQALNQYGYYSGPPVGQLTDSSRNGAGLLWWRLVSTPYESMAFVARSRSKALGAVAGVGGVVSQDINIGPGSPTNLGSTRPDHSGEFSRNIQELQGFCQTLSDIIK